MSKERRDLYLRARYLNDSLRLIVWAIEEGRSAVPDQYPLSPDYKYVTGAADRHYYGLTIEMHFNKSTGQFYAPEYHFDTGSYSHFLLRQPEVFERIAKTLRRIEKEVSLLERGWPMVDLQNLFEVLGCKGFIELGHAGERDKIWSRAIGFSRIQEWANDIVATHANKYAA
jgi:hypothetical protein